MTDPELERARRGLVARDPELRVAGPAGEALVEPARYAFLEDERAPETVHPGLWAQARRNAPHGLFAVTDGVWQVRGYDISNMTLVAGETGWIVVDPLTTRQTAAAALELARRHLGDRPVAAVVYTHSHADHFGGALGVVSADAVAAGAVRVIAPEGFTEAAISENVLAGNAMLRRAQYMFGSLLEPGPRGHVDSGLGRAIPRALPSFLAPTELVTPDHTSLELDGVRFDFHLTPDTEAPAEMNFHLPDLRALCMAENCTCTMHNLYTPRGAPVRDALRWSVLIDEALERFGATSDVLFAGHHWPRWGRADIEAFLGTQRDLYRYLHDQTLRWANHGYTAEEIAERVELPPALAADVTVGGFYGTVSHNVKAVYQRYLGWFDGNPANLHPLPPVEAARRTVAYMGGSEAVLARARADAERGDLRWVARVVDQVVHAEPGNAEARELQADVLTRLGYAAESGPWRDFYLTGAQELREGVRPAARTVEGSFVAAMPVGLIFQFLAVRLDGPRAGDRRILVNWRFTDTGEEYVLRLSNGTLSHVEGRVDEHADATITLARSSLTALLLLASGAEDVAPPADVRVEGRQDAFAEILGLLDTFTPDFPIVTPRP